MPSVWCLGNFGVKGGHQVKNLPKEFFSHYEQDTEDSRLSGPKGQLEFSRTREIILHHLRRPPAKIVDVGGGTGPYAFWLASEGYEVDLIDPVELHLQKAREHEKKQSLRLNRIFQGDARKLEYPDNSVDAVLYLGPLYHLTEREDRILALREGFRVLKPKGLLFAVGISKFTSALNGLFHNVFQDEDFIQVVRKDLINGQHTNLPGKNFFTTAFFHHPEELKSEVIESGFCLRDFLSVEGPSWLMNNLGQFWNDPRLKEILLEIIRSTEREPSLIGQSIHFLAVGEK